ncbi:MAG: hypothetical protein JNM00_14540, partial [Flavobacteriales bacterium]|nr:hypothetical protein [Flavobacteriales bacterium]
MNVCQSLPRRSWTKCLCSTFLFVLLFADPSFGQDTIASNQKVADAINAFIGSKDFKVTTLTYSNENGEKKATGAIEMWGIPGIQLDAVVTGEDTTVKEITLSFPSASNLSIGKLNGVTGGVLTSYLPSGFPLEAGASLNSIGLKLNGSSLSECSVLFGTAEAWRILGSDAVALNQISTEFIVENPRNAESRKFTGNITAKCALGDALINLTASLTQNKEEISFTGEFNNIGIENLLNAVSDAEQGAGIVELIPAQIRSLK